MVCYGGSIEDGGEFVWVCVVVFVMDVDGVCFDERVFCGYVC